MATYDIKDKVFLVTGGADGIGAGFVRTVARDAKHVAIIDLDANRGTALQNELNAKYGENRSKFYKVDVTDETQIDETFDKIVKQFGYIDVVLNNAGIMNDSPKVFKKQIEVNVGALIYLSMKFYNFARKDRSGHGGTIINIASVAALMNTHFAPIYSATKSAVLQFSVCLGDERNFERTGVRVVAMCFGATNTALFDDRKMMMYDEEFTQMLKHQLTHEMSMQKTESAVEGIVEAYKKGGPGSTWVIVNDQPAVDYTSQVKKAYDLLTSIMP